MNLTKNRAQHSLGAAHHVFKHAPSYRNRPNGSFLAGWLHDMGYETGGRRTHAETGGSILKSQGYKYWKEITMHGTIQGLISNMGILLNQADLRIDPTGEEVDSKPVLTIHPISGTFDAYQGTHHNTGQQSAQHQRYHSLQHLKPSCILYLYIQGSA